MKVFGCINEGIPSHHPVVLGDEGVLHDGVEPSLEVGAIGKLLTVGNGLEHGLLHQVIGIFGITCELQCKRTKEPRQALYLCVKLNCIQLDSPLRLP